MGVLLLDCVQEVRLVRRNCDDEFDPTGEGGGEVPDYLNTNAVLQLIQTLEQKDKRPFGARKES